jgi:hypothetical protein
MIEAPLESLFNGASSGAPFSNWLFSEFKGAVKAGRSAQAEFDQFGPKWVTPWLQAKGEADEALLPQAGSCLGCVLTFRVGIKMAEAMRAWQP